MTRDKIESLIHKSIQVKQGLLEDKTLLRSIERTINIVEKALRRGKKLLLFGNGGSAADAQHFAAELVGRFKHNKKALPAISLVTDTSVLSGISNDFGYDYVFSRQIEALGEKGDVVIAFTTSDSENKRGGHSVNIMHGLKTAGRKGLKRILLCSHKTKRLLPFVDVAIQVPADDTQRIQEVHVMLIHIICEFIKGDTKNK
jgi:D-sedoheptulose 7-phosphate isomerase